MIDSAYCEEGQGNDNRSADADAEECIPQQGPGGEEELAENCHCGDRHQPEDGSSLILGQFVQEHCCEEAADDREYLHDALMQSGGSAVVPCDSSMVGHHVRTV